MATATELVFAEELAALREIAEQKGWLIEVVGPKSFVLELPFNGGTVKFRVDCDDYPGFPPAWHIQNAENGALDQPADLPFQGGYFHNSGVICATWNRLAYKEYHAAGPHGGWVMGDWKKQPQTGGTTSLCAMAIRISVELAGHE